MTMSTWIIGPATRYQASLEEMPLASKYVGDITQSVRDTKFTLLCISG